MLPTIMHVSLEVDPSAVQPSQETPALADSWTAASSETLQQRAQLSPAQAPGPQKLRARCFKPLIVGVNCHTATDN